MPSGPGAKRSVLVAYASLEYVPCSPDHVTTLDIKHVGDAAPVQNLASLRLWSSIYAARPGRVLDAMPLDVHEGAIRDGR